MAFIVDELMGVRILSKCQLPSYNRLGIELFQIFRRTTLFSLSVMIHRVWLLSHPCPYAQMGSFLDFCTFFLDMLCCIGELIVCDQ